MLEATLLRKVMTIKQRSAKDILSPAQLMKSRLGRVKNGDIVLIPPYLLKNLYTLRHVDIVTRLSNENTIADGELKFKYWNHILFEPAYYNKLFDQIDEVQKAMPDKIGIVQAIVATVNSRSVFRKSAPKIPRDQSKVKSRG